jgi:hypothetical protein
MSDAACQGCFYGYQTKSDNLRLMGVYMSVGQVVSLIQFGGSIIRRVVVAVENGHVFVCKEEEFEASRLECREPVSIGFRLQDLAQTE